MDVIKRDGSREAFDFAKIERLNEFATQGLNVDLGLLRSQIKLLVYDGMQTREIEWEAKLRGVTPERVVDDYVAATPLGRLETPEDVADVVVFLCSNSARFMTGQGINVTGGVYMT